MKFPLKEKELEFFVDEIYPADNSLEIFSVRVIPCINSAIFPPCHMRNINVTAELLEKDLYRAIAIKENPNVMNMDQMFLGSVIQSGYYSIPEEHLQDGLFREDILVTGENPREYQKKFTLIKDIFSDNRKPSPYKKEDYLKSKITPAGEAKDILNDTTEVQRVGALYIYFLYVGQGDSSLVIFPNGNTYLIDTNYYNGSHHNINEYKQQIESILNFHGLPLDHLKALIITHKHIDHLRGAANILDEFTIDFLIMNFDYEHETNAVVWFLKSARKIGTWINLNQHVTYWEGNCTVRFVNPDAMTNTRRVAPDVNDSSLVICLEYGEDKVYLTGDAGFPILEHKLSKFSSLHNLLKVSHHGSTTGTSKKLLNNIKLEQAFISAGYNKRYCHPDSKVVDTLRQKTGRAKTIISKKIKRPCKYTVSGRGITRCP